MAALIQGLPEAPQYFKHNAAMNKQGPPLVNWDAALPGEKPPIMELTKPEQFYVVDLRDAAEYEQGHIPNAVNIALRGKLETWTGVMVPWGAKLVLVGNKEELKEGLFRLNRIGYSPEIITMESWKKAGSAGHGEQPHHPERAVRLNEGRGRPRSLWMCVFLRSGWPCGSGRC